MAVAGSLTYDTNINKDGFEKGLDGLKSSTVAVGNLMAEAFNKVAGVLQNVATTGIEYNAKIEQYKVGLKTLLGSSEQASAVMSQIQQDAQTTPFSVDNLIQAERLLISTGLSASDSRNTILALGDAVSATGGGNDDLSRMAINLQQIKNVGQASALDIKQFAFAGIDMYSLVADYTGKSKEEVANMNISYDVLAGALQKASSEGGKYYNSMNAQSKTLNGQLSNLEDGFNTLAGSAMKPINDFLKNTLLPNVNNLISKLQERFDSGNWNDIINIIKIIGAIIVPLISGIGIIWGYFKAVQIINNIKNAIIALNLAMSANPIVFIIGLIVALVAGFIYLWNNCEAFRNFWIGLWNGIKNVFQAIWNGIIGFYINTIPTAFRNLQNGISQIINSIKQFFINAWNSIVTFFTVGIPTFIGNVLAWIAKLPYNIGYLLGTIIGDIIKLGQNIWNWITTDLPQIITGIVNWFAQLPGRIWDWLVNAYNNILNWEINTYKSVTTWIGNTINAVIDWFSKLPGRIWDWLVSAYSKTIDWINNMRSGMSNGIHDIISNVIQWFEELPGRMLDIGKNIVTGIWNGIINAKDWLIGKVKEFAKGILDGIKNGLGIHSPSTKARDLAKFVPQGIAIGIEADTDKALDAVDKMNSSILDKMTNAVGIETGSINATASVKSNNSMLNVIQANFAVDGSVNIDGQKAGRIMTPSIVKTLRLAGVN